MSSFFFENKKPRADVRPTRRQGKRATFQESMNQIPNNSIIKGVRRLVLWINEMKKLTILHRNYAKRESNIITEKRNINRVGKRIVFTHINDYIWKIPTCDVWKYCHFDGFLNGQQTKGIMSSCRHIGLCLVIILIEYVNILVYISVLQIYIYH